jgi:Zn finger protein HypA/HybF involved in hydrogenase expression
VSLNSGEHFAPLLILVYQKKKRLDGGKMQCWHCETELIWGGDHDVEDDEDHDMVTNLSCPECHSFILVYKPKEEF